MAMMSLWLFVAVLFTLRTYVAVKGLPTQNLHHHMTKREIEDFFDVDDHDKVPKYDISHPYQSNEQGDFVSYSLHQSRNKRDTESQEPSFYKLDAFGSKLHLKLKRNDHLMAPGLQREIRNTFYLGQVASDPRSTVAVSKDGGLTGMVKTSRDALFVRPLPAHLAKHVTNNEDATPHLVYRRSLKDRKDWCETPQDQETIRLRRAMDNEDVSNAMSDSSPPLFKTLKVNLMYPQSLADKYANSSLGDVKTFLLVVANMVAGMFQDPSFGKIKVTYVVTDISVIDPQKCGFSVIDSNSVKLTKILRKVMRDNAVAKVPYDVWSYVSNQISSGALAVADTICSVPTGNVNKELGLQTALHIAHETGHNMWLGHDQDSSCPGGYIMSTHLPGGEHATEWSKCSRDAIQKFLADGGRSSCLQDGPTGNGHIIPPRFQNKLPGEILDGDKQCEKMYGPGYKRYDTMHCTVLKCLKGYTILSENVAVADGTICGPDMWCIKGKCQDTGRVVDGGWTDWVQTACTRECGGGVQYRSRKCINPRPQHGGKPCPGKDREYTICNPQACPPGTKNFRQTQCDRIKPGSRYYYYGGGYQCSLVCISDKARLHTLVDGTRCTQNEKDYRVCIKGTCRPVGCDHVLDSNTKVDRCGVCGGNGASCSKVSSTYTGNPIEMGPDNAALIAELPPGTKQAFFQMKAYSLSYLGVQDADGKYLVGGHLGGDQTKHAAGTVIVYKHNVKRKSQDGLSIVNPTNAVLKVMFIKRGMAANPGVRYQYVSPTSSAPGDVYKWVIGSWSGCSKTCAAGTKKRSIHCVRKDDSSPAGDSACPKPIPNVTEPCNTQPCKAKWVLQWTMCSKTCGLGKQTRQAKCIQEVSENNFTETDTCTDAKPTDPIIHRDCNSYPCPAEWNVGDWSKCSTKCGIGKKRRQISCSRIDEAGKFTVIADEFCRYLNKPSTEEPCNEDNPCALRPPNCPAVHDCANGGQCQSNPSGYKCVCDRGFTGMDCEIKLNPCDNNPCMNGGSCSPGVGHHYDHTCTCTELFKGRNCETAVTACMKDPCLNGATCADNGASDRYNCTCPQGFTGPRCQVSIFYKIGCFVWNKEIPLIQKGVARQLNTERVLKCAELAEAKGYTSFALSHNGNCHSAPVKDVVYFKKGPAGKGKCIDGVGTHGNTFVYTFAPLPTYEQLGCYVFKRSKGRRWRAFNIKYMSFEKQFERRDTKATIEKCAWVARARGFAYFSVRKLAQCWSDGNAAEVFSKYGHSSDCKDGVGKKMTHVVYRFKG